MAEGKSDSQGNFELKGHTDEFTTIDPKLNVYHDCEDALTVSAEFQDQKRKLHSLAVFVEHLFERAGNAPHRDFVKHHSTPRALVPQSVLFNT
ncbi:unnamed protein product [Toxocara canis]|uniref:Transthyretin-like family protein n=1 Tax=Toxocara canis TaxID=6265 RepID=A0A183U9V1_TOXCA|nr:unnamed protein product [Toxocara canis]